MACAELTPLPPRSLQRLKARWRADGLDLTHAFQVGQSDAIPTAAPAEALAVIIGNTRALWPPFLHALRRDDTLRDDPDRLNHHVERAITRALNDLSHPHEIHWSHAEAPLPIQKVCDDAGLARLSPSHLCVHPQHGPWIALRAVVVFPTLQGPHAPDAEDLCGACARKPCLPALERAMSATNAPTRDAMEEVWRLWLDMRDACPVGRDARYCDEQIAYHYARRLPTTLDPA